MSDQTFNTRHSLTGKLQRLTADQISVMPEYLEIVPDDAKPYEPGLFKPGKVGEFEPPQDEPQTPTIQSLLDEYLRLSAEHAPNSKVVRDAKAALDEAQDAYDAEQAALQAEADAAVTNGEADATVKAEGAE